MGMINDITKVTSKVMGVNIRRFNIGTEDGIFDGFIDLYVNDMENLESLIKRIQRIKGIESVSRKDL
jgi:GTP pyrophosphokinase